METTIVHDYLTQRGGAERVVVVMLEAFPDAPVYTSLYDPNGTFPEFRQRSVRTTYLNRLVPLRRRHRVALPLLAPAFSRMDVPGDVVICSSSGWAHGSRVSGRKIVYCHTPARWLYQTGRYLRSSRGLARLAVEALRRPLESWDKRAAATASRYLVNSTAVQTRVREIYGIEAEVLAPPPALTPDGPLEPIEGVEHGFFLCVSRLLPYKNVAAVSAALRALPDHRLIVVGSGPELTRLLSAAPPNVQFIQSVRDGELRWLYSASKALVAASYEDFGLTPLEAASFGKPVAVLRWGGFLDTVREGVTGVFFDEPSPTAITAALDRLSNSPWNPRALADHVEEFSRARFARRLRQIVVEEGGA
jgi:glycosyltransferase involved in cell wall biosynthesis